MKISKWTVFAGVWFAFGSAVSGDYYGNSQTEAGTSTGGTTSTNWQGDINRYTTTPHPYYAPDRDTAEGRKEYPDRRYNYERYRSSTGKGAK